MATGLSPKFPLTIAFEGDFSLNQNVKEMVKQNFKNLLLTVPGERIMIPDFGAGIQRFLFEQKGVGTFESMSAIISEQISKYMPYIQVTNLDITGNDTTEELVTIKISYFIKPLSETDLIEITAT